MARGLGTALMLLALALPSAALALPADHWTEAFEASPAAYVFGPALQAAMRSANRTVTGTVRFTLTLAAGGTAVRVRLTNEEGDQPLQIDSATVALAAESPDGAHGEIRPLTFHGQASITIPAGAPALSDPVPLHTKAFDRLVVSTYLPQTASFMPMGGAAMRIGLGDQTRAATLQDAKPLIGRPLVSGVAVEDDRPLPVVVAFGDSLTDGARRTPDALHGYPDELARRLMALAPRQRRSVVNAGIGGNQILATSWGKGALSRLDRDVLRIPRVSHLILMEGINDIGNSGPSSMDPGPQVGADEIIAGYRQIIARAHASGLRVIGGTLMPFKGAHYYTAKKEQIREQVNRWIRTAGEFDRVIDFEAAVRDPADPLKYRPEFDSGDHLHPNDAGYKAMGDAIDLGVFD